MRMLKIIIFIPALILFMIACNDGQKDKDTHHIESRAMEEGHEGHKVNQDGTIKVKDKSGPEYTSDYVCLMHCEGSGSDEPGKCPVCGMEYVLNDK